MDYNALAEMMTESFISAIKPSFVAALPFLAIGTLILAARYTAGKVWNFLTGKLR